MVTAGAANKRSGVAAALEDLFDAQVLPGKREAEHLLDRILVPTGAGAVARNIRSLNQAIVDRAGTFDILFVVKGNFVTASTLELLKSRPHPPIIMCWTCDDIYLPHNSSVRLRKACRHYDIIFTTKSLNIERKELLTMGFPRAEFIIQGFDSDFHKPAPDPGSPYVGKVIFIGFGEQDRLEKMTRLAESGIEVHIWGNGWPPRMTRGAHPNLHFYGKPLTGHAYAEAISNAAVNLCFLRKLNRDRHTSRSIEIPACAGFMLAERTNEHLALFEDGKEAVFFDSDDDLVRKTRHYLANPQEAADIASAGYRRTRASDYSYHRLAADMIRRGLELPESGA